MKSGGAGGQNVNKKNGGPSCPSSDGHRRPCGCGEIAGSKQRKSDGNFKIKLYKLQLEEQKEEKDSMRRNKGVEAEWGGIRYGRMFSSIKDGERPPDGSGETGQCGRSS